MKKKQSVNSALLEEDHNACNNLFAMESARLFSEIINLIYLEDNMCGIAGVYFKKKNDEKKLKRFKELVKIKQQGRGPDHFGSLKITDKLHFFHNRLSIIDINHAFQPMQDDAAVLVYNGEIYNYQELKKNSIEYKTLIISK